MTPPKDTESPTNTSNQLNGTQPVRNIIALALTVQKLLARLKFSKVGQTLRSRSQCQNSWYPQKGLDSRNADVKYQSSSFHFQELLVKFKFQTDLQIYRMTE